MPIGFDTGAGGGYIAPPTNTRNATEAGTRVGERVAEQVPVWELVQLGRDVWEWVLETIAELYPVEWRAWAVHNDERLCPECSIYAGDQWEADTWHPAPPLHVNCRCNEYLHHIEWRTRYVAVWRLRAKRVTWWEWDITSWETEWTTIWR